MRGLAMLLLISSLLSTGCAPTHTVKGSMVTVTNDDKADSEIKGKLFKLRYVNSEVFDKTIAMYVTKDAGELDVLISSGISTNTIPKRLDDIFVAAVDNGAELNMVDEKAEEKTRSLGIIVAAVISAYSDYQKVSETYRQYMDKRSQAKLGNYVINVYYSANNGNISHVKFTRREMEQ